MTNNTISAVERRRRESAVNFAWASIGLSGLTPSAEAEPQAQRFINGEIDLAEFVQASAKTDFDNPIDGES